jgi:hypothetical protein
MIRNLLSSQSVNFVFKNSSFSLSIMKCDPESSN